MLLGDFCIGLVQHSHLGHLGTHLLDWELPPAVLMVLRFLLILLIYFGIKVSYDFCCFVCCSGPTLGANIMSLASSLATTAGTNIIKTAIVFVH